MGQRTARAIVDVVYDLVREAMIGSTNSMPLAYIFFDDREPAIFPLPWHNDDVKHAMLEAFRRFMRETGATGYAVSSEIGISVHDPKGQGSFNSECLIVYAEQLRRPMPTEVYFRAWEIARDEAGVVLRLTSILDNPAGVWSGIIGGLLDDAPARKH